MGVRIIHIAVLVTSSYILTGVNGYCPAGTAEPVVNMCYDGAEDGTTVNLDAAGAIDTPNNASSSCKCVAEIRGTTSALVRLVSSPGYTGCGSAVKIDHDQFQAQINCQGSVFPLSFGSSNTNISLELIKIRSPYEFNYCLQFIIGSGTMVIRCEKSSSLNGTTKAPTTTTTKAPTTTIKPTTEPPVTTKPPTTIPPTTKPPTTIPPTTIPPPTTKPQTTVTVAPTTTKKPLTTAQPLTTKEPTDPVITTLKPTTAGSTSAEQETTITTEKTTETTTDGNQTKPDTTTKKAGLDEESKNIIVIAAASGCLLLILIVLVICQCCRKKDNRQSGYTPSNLETADSPNGVQGKPMSFENNSFEPDKVERGHGDRVEQGRSYENVAGDYDHVSFDNADRGHVPDSVEQTYDHVTAEQGYDPEKLELSSMDTTKLTESEAYLP